MRSIVSCIQAQARIRPQNIAVISGDTETSYQDLWMQVAAAAAWYRDSGVRAGEPVLLSTDSRNPYFVASYFGAHLAGAIAVPTSFRASAAEIEQRMEILGSKFSVFGERLTMLRQCLISSTTHPYVDRCIEIPDLSEVAEIMFTTGTSGKPKGVTLSHRNISASAEMIRSFVGNTEEDREVVTVPLTHSFGLGRLRSIILAGGTAILVPGLTFPQLAIRALREHAATGLACVPAGMILLLSKFEESLAKLAGQLKYLELGSMRLPLKFKNRLREILPNTRLCMHYGLTEASRSTFLEFHTDSDHLESIGKPSPGVEISIRGRDKLEVPAEEIGVIHVRAPTVMEGYWNDKTRTAQVLDRDRGWLNTNDLGYKGTDEYVYFLGRADDVINSGGEKVVPDEVESIAGEYRGVEDCGCIGVPDPDGILGEIPLLFVASKDRALDLVELPRFVCDRLGGEVPIIKVRLLSEIPRSASGKLLRRELRSIYDDEQSTSV